MSTSGRIGAIVIGIALLLTLYGGDARAVTLCPPELVFHTSGGSVSDAGDVNNDGYPDMIMNTHGYRVCVTSGLNGDTLFIFYPEEYTDRFGASISGAGDVNNDGYDDVIIGASQDSPNNSGGGLAYVFSGLDGDTLYLFTGEDNDDSFGASVSAAGDVNNDGYDDLIVGAHKNAVNGIMAGRVYVFSGLNGDTLYVYTGESNYSHLGVSVSGAGDVNGDGYSDFVVGDAGRAYVFSGLDGDTLHVFDDNGSGIGIGSSVSGAGDVNNDGYDDLIIGAWSYDTPGTNTGRAYVFSGLDGDTLHVFTGEAKSDKFGRSVSGAGDANGDGYADLLVGAAFGGGAHLGRAYVFSGGDGSLLHMFTGETVEGYFAISVSGVGDVNHDGFDDIIVGALRDPRAYVFTLGDACTSCCLDARGNINGDLGDSIDIADLTYFVDYIFNGGAPSPCPIEGDVNGSGETDIADLVYLVEYLLLGGLPPVSCQGL